MQSPCDAARSEQDLKVMAVAAQWLPLGDEAGSVTGNV